MTKTCKDCPPESKRPAPHPGPRCATHSREWRKRNSERAHGRHVQATYELTSEEYWAIYEAQAGRCPLCLQATGATRRLCVDHDHELAKLHDHPVDRGCRLCIRGLLDRRCNRYGVPLNMAAQLRAIEYLSNPPARKVLNP